ncbi:hypothetical protein LTR95_001530 [Oleoguttula sp. CCFEE 5521]
MDSDSSNAPSASGTPGKVALANTADGPPAPQKVTHISREKVAESSTLRPGDQRNDAQSEGSAAITPPMSGIERVTRALLNTLSETAAMIPETRPSCVPGTALQASTSTGSNNLATLADAAATGARISATGSTEQAAPQDNAAGVTPELFGMLIGYGYNIRQSWAVANGTRAQIDANAEAFGRELEELRNRFNMLEMQFDHPDNQISEKSGEDDKAGPSTTKLSPTTKPSSSASRSEKEQWKQYVMKLVGDLNDIIDTQRPVVRNASAVIERSEQILELLRMDDEQIVERLALGKGKGKGKEKKR